VTLDDLVRNARFTVLLGKNGSGKSTLLRKLDSSGTFGAKYISPERGGTLKYDPNIEQNMSNANWMIQDRRKNRTEYFRQQSATQFRNLEVLVLREIEQQPDKRRDSNYTFNSTLDKINALLPAIELRRADRGFKICSKTGTEIPEDQISSGEAELIALAIEVLVFARESNTNKLLLLDEPDVHLHPDLQQRFVAFIEAAAREFDFRVVLATHSTAVIGAFPKGAQMQIAPITNRAQTDFHHFGYDPICQEILPVFGVHPLSAQFNRSPALLVEGEDDKRVFDQVVRSSDGRIVLTPCVVGTVDEMYKWESWLNEFLPSIYDQPLALSLRDLDDSGQCAIDDLGCVSRARLNCYSVENLLLTDECFAIHGTDGAAFKTALEEWVRQRPSHQASAELQALAGQFENRRTLKIKDTRNVIVALLGTQKPWEVLVGQLLANHDEAGATAAHSIARYLGPDVRRKILGLSIVASGES
jgi:predicted ATPase